MSDKKTERLTIRLLKDGKAPNDIVRGGVTLRDWPAIEGAQIVLGSTGGNTPKWARFLKLSTEQTSILDNRSAFGVAFLSTHGRWFAISFGLGHVKLDPACIEHDFGLRVVLNSVDPAKLRSADLRTPDENSLTKRTQASRRSSQEAFNIDPERDIVRGLAGEPRDKAFGSKVAGSDALAVWIKAEVSDLPRICAESLAAFGGKEYQREFGWIDHIRHEREAAIIDRLDGALIEAINRAIAGSTPETLHLAWPTIYDPHTASCVRYKGFRSQEVFPDLDIRNYVAELKKHGIVSIDTAGFRRHHVEQTDENGDRVGDEFDIRECCVFEAELDSRTYVLSGARWYDVSKSFADDVREFFARADRYDMPAARAGENEATYNRRLASEQSDWICLDRKMIRPTGAASRIEACDFFVPPNHFVHIKDQSASSKLSHLFNQGLVSAEVFKTDGQFRDKVREIALKKSNGAPGNDIPPGGDIVNAGNFTVVFVVLREHTGTSLPMLPFFSLVTFRQAAKRLEALGYKCAFAWVFKEEPPKGISRKRKRKPESETVAISGVAETPLQHDRGKP